MFKRFFSRPAKEVEEMPASHPFDSMSAREIVAALTDSEIDGGVPSHTSIKAYFRLLAISMFDHHVEQDERELAAKLATAVRADLEAFLSDNPSGLRTFREAADFEFDQVHFSGVGSLQWLLEEHEITTENLVEFVVQPQFSDLLPTYLSVLDDQTINQIRNGMVRALINARRQSPEDSEFRVLDDMVRSGDRSLNILLKTNELETIRKSNTSPEALIAAAMIVHVLFGSS